MADTAKFSGKLKELSTGDGVTIDFDPGTKGILFDPGEAALYFDLSRDIPDLAWEGAEKTGITWTCPKHPGSTMVEYRFPRLDGLQLDICEERGCIWFDHGEVPRFEELVSNLQEPRSRVFRAFQRLRDSGIRALGLKSDSGSEG